MAFCIKRITIVIAILLTIPACDREEKSGHAITNNVTHKADLQVPKNIGGASTPSSRIETDNSLAKFRIVDKFSYDWARDGSNYEFILSIPELWDDPGDYTDLKILRNGKLVYSITDNNGLVKYISDIPKNMQAKNLVASSYLLMMSGQDELSRSILFVFGNSYSSEPGSLRIVLLSNGGIPKEVLYKKNYEVHALINLNLDPRLELAGQECYPESLSEPNSYTYTPFTVYTFGEDSSSLMIMDLALSEKYNKEYYFKWAGPSCSSGIPVVIPPDSPLRPRIWSRYN